MIRMRRAISLGSLSSNLDSLAGVGPGAAAPPPGSSGGSWTNTTTVHTNDGATGRNESNVVTQSSHDANFKANPVAVGSAVAGGVIILVMVAALLFNEWRKRVAEREIARINNPVGAAAERAAKAEEAAKRADNPLKGLLPIVGRFLRGVLWTGFPKKKESEDGNGDENLVLPITNQQTADATKSPATVATKG